MFSWRLRRGGQVYCTVFVWLGSGACRFVSVFFGGCTVVGDLFLATGCKHEQPSFKPREHPKLELAMKPNPENLTLSVNPIPS